MKFSVSTTYATYIKLFLSLRVSNKNKEGQNSFYLNCDISCRSRYLTIFLGFPPTQCNVSFNRFSFLFFKQEQTGHAVNQK